jgi:hypothetical protein
VHDAAAQAERRDHQRESSYRAIHERSTVINGFVNHRLQSVAKKHE